jgi:hypothetical protein
MEFYINEISLQGQYTNPHEAVAALTNYNQLLSFLHEKQVAGFWQQDLLFHYDRKTLQNEAFQVSLDRNPRIGASFRQLVGGKLKAKDWRNDRLHSDSDFYFYNENLVTDKTVAEIAERNLQDSDTPRLLLNFALSDFQNLSAFSIFKNEKTAIKIDCADEKTVLETWFNTFFKPKTQPKDAFLSENPSRFQKTKFTVKGATIYIEIATNYRWYMDTFHGTDTHDTHFEVFNAQKIHLGEADLSGNLDVSKKDKRKNGKIPI